MYKKVSADNAQARPKLPRSRSPQAPLSFEQQLKQTGIKLIPYNKSIVLDQKQWKRYFGEVTPQQFVNCLIRGLEVAKDSVSVSIRPSYLGDPEHPEKRAGLMQIRLSGKLRKGGPFFIIEEIDYYKQRTETTCEEAPPEIARQIRLNFIALYQDIQISFLVNHIKRDSREAIHQGFVPKNKEEWQRLQDQLKIASIKQSSLD
jgi:hypothetical protein